MSQPKSSNQISPDQAIAICTREQAERLVKFDHHVVDIDGKAGVMLTYDWIPMEEHAGPLVLTVVFRYADRHPTAPAEIQSLINELKFQVRGQPR